jgi:hypothetical protein
MGRSRWLCSWTPLLLVALSRPALAGISPPGVNLRWDNCYADGGASNRNFACNTNDGQDQLVGSFELAQEVDRVVTAEIVLDLRSASATLPAWWNVFNSGSCRPLALDLLTYPSSDPSQCVQWIGYPAGGGISAYSVGEQGPAHVRLKAAVALRLANAVTLNPGQEYFAFRLTLNHAKTVGAAACAGCSTPICIFLSRISLYVVGVSAPAISLDHGANWEGSQYVTWQNGYPVDVQRECDPSVPNCTLHYTSFGCVPYSVTDAGHSTWGAVKAHYR